MKTRLATLGLALLAGTALATDIVVEEVTYTDGGTHFSGYAVHDGAVAEKRPGVLIVHQWTGPGRYELYRARMLAAAGYAVFVADIYGTDDAGNLIRPASGPAARDVAGRFREGDRQLFRDRLQLALAQLSAMPSVDPDRLAAIGYCFGGTGVLELARAGAAVNVVVSVHGGLDSPAPADGANIRASVLILHASNDPTTPPDQIAALVHELDTHEVDWQMNLYTHQGHSFTDPEGAGFNPVADRRAWAAQMLFLAEHLGVGVDQ